MPSANVTDMGVILKNSSNDYIAMKFFPSKNDTTGAYADNFYWIDSTSSGNAIDSRSNAKNGYFSSYEDAMDNIPSGYTGVPSVDNFINSYEIGYLNMFPFDAGNLLGYPTPEARTKSEYAVAATKGMNTAMVVIDWDAVFTTYSQQTANSSTSWAKYDDLINYYKTLTTVSGTPMNIALRIKVSKDDSLHYDLEDPSNTNGWYGLSNSAKDQLGYVVRIGQGIGHVSLAYSTGLAQVYDFVTKVVQRYKGILGSQLSWCSVVFSSQDEDGYNYENQNYATGSLSPLYPAIYDYSSHSIAAFKTWLASSAKYNGSISALNTIWGTSYGSFSDVVPPGQGVTGTHEELSAIYATNKGKDWYEWNFKLIKDFLTSCETIIEAESVRFCTETGSDTDILSPRRHTIDVKAFSQIGSMHKSQLGGIARDPSFAISLDVLRENIEQQGIKLGTEINTNDFVTQQGITDPFLMQSVMTELMQSCIDSANARSIIFISRKEGGYFDTAMNVMQATRAYMLNHSSKVPASMNSFEYTINQILNNGISWLKQQWTNTGGSLLSRVKAIQTSNNVLEPETCVYPFQIYPIQQYCMSSGSILYDNNSDNFDTLKNTHFVLYLATHSISYVSGQLTKANYTVKGNTDNIEYVKNTQYEGFYTDNVSINMDSPYRNNHPEKRYGASVSSAVVLPLGQTYTIEMTNTTPSNALTFLVQNLDINPAGDSPTVYRKKLTGTSSFTFNPNSVTTNYIRQVKINCNRTSTTDTDSDI